jgi:hypothetical protein
MHKYSTHIEENEPVFSYSYKDNELKNMNAYFVLAIQQ